MLLYLFSLFPHGFFRPFCRRAGVRIVAGLTVSLLLISCDSGADKTLTTPESQEPVSAEQQRLERFFAATWEEDLIRSPASASYLGVTDYQDQWNNVS